jgi:cell division septum initiation protein DivIVA
MIWRSQKNGPEEKRAEPRGEEAVPNAPDPATSRAAMSSVGERVESVLEAAERAAADIRRDAEQWAQRHMEETRKRADELAAKRVHELSSVTDDLLVRAKVVAKQSEGLISALDEARRRALKVPLESEDDDQGNSASEASQPDPEPKAEGDPTVVPNGPVSKGARLLATQMAVAGANRDTIGSRLKEEFGIEDPSAILDEAGI